MEIQFLQEDTLLLQYGYMQIVAGSDINSALDWMVGEFPLNWGGGWTEFRVSPRKKVWVRDLAGTRAGKLFLVLGLLLFTSINCEDKTNDNNNLCYSLGSIFFIFDQYLEFNFVPKLLTWGIWALQAQSSFFKL